MDIGQIKQKIKQNEFLKKIVFYSITSPKNPKPRCWVKWFVNPWIHKKGKGAIIRRRRSRIDVFPWNQFTVGKNSLHDHQQWGRRCYHRRQRPYWNRFGGDWSRTIRK